MGQLIVLDGCTFFTSDETGDTDSGSEEGFFNEDVRHLSRWELLVDGKPIDVLTSKRVTTTRRESSAGRTTNECTW